MIFWLLYTSTNNFFPINLQAFKYHVETIFWDSHKNIIWCDYMKCIYLDEINLVYHAQNNISLPTLRIKTLKIHNTK